jgi:hypothetical protein
LAVINNNNNNNNNVRKLYEERSTADLIMRAMLEQETPTKTLRIPSPKYKRKQAQYTNNHASISQALCTHSSKTSNKRFTFELNCLTWEE